MKRLSSSLFFKIFFVFFFLNCFSLTSCKKEQTVIGPSEKYYAVSIELKRVIDHEMRDKQLPALSLSLVDDQEIVWAEGFGMADPEQNIPATMETVYRIGSVSKLFTDIAIMQLAEHGDLLLDVPVIQYLPDFKPKNPFKKPITLRHLMSHRSGLVREPPAGNYFDPTEFSLAQTVESLNKTQLVYKPGDQTKYSNAGIAAVGFVLESTQKEPFPQYLKRSVLQPMGLVKSSFEPEELTIKDLAKAFMWTHDGRIFEAPTFELGMAPAGCLYSTVTDLARFLSVLFNGGKGPEEQVLKKESLEVMWTPQFSKPEEKEGFGIGFNISEFEGFRCVGHSGAIYGFATQLSALPEAKLGVSVVTTMDAANSVIKRIADHALNLMLAVRKGEPLPKMNLTKPVNPSLARRLKGRYERDEQRFDLVERNGRLFMMKRELFMELKSLGNRLVVDDRHVYGPEIVIRGEELLVEGKTFMREEVPKPELIPWHMRGLIGEYGWDHNTLYILEKEGQLHVQIEWFFSYPLERKSDNTYAFPDYGLYQGEKLIFTRDKRRRATQVEAANVVFKRRTVSTEEGETFTITPVKPIEELRELALQALPPREEGRFLPTDLVDLSKLDRTIRFDIRYAKTNNFMSTRFYKRSKAFLQRKAAEALLRAHKNLRKKGFGLLIYDAYRPWYVTKIFWDATPEDKKIFVANPAQGSRHNRGAAVDLTLYNLNTRRPVQVVGGYDEMSSRSNVNYFGGTSLQRWHRDLLRDAMEEQGFTVYLHEWWHFDYKDWNRYPIMNLTFEQVLKFQKRR